MPFCPQSILSGVGHTDFIQGVWYRRTVSLTDAQAAGRVVLHFGAVDYRCEAFVNGVSAGRHTGGYVSFAFDVTELVHAGENVITVCAEDDERDGLIPSGKQSERYGSYGCMYTRTTGIWQTVWMEFMPRTHVEKVKYVPSLEQSALSVTAALSGAAAAEAHRQNTRAALAGRSVRAGRGRHAFR